MDIAATLPTPFPGDASLPEGRAGRVCAVMVTHCTGESLEQLAPALLAQVDRLTIVDNCSDVATRGIAARLAAAHPDRLEVILRETNNLAAAQNDGIRRALEDGYGWVLLMDDDSLPAPNMVAALRSAWAQAPSPQTIGILAPCLTDRHSGRQPRYPQAAGRLGVRRVGFGEGPILDGLLGVIASGSLIATEVFRAVGLMDEALCIDYVDKDFCLRAVRGGYRIIAVKDAVLNHRLGECRDHRLLGLRVTTTNHSPERCYYIFRNRMRSWAKHGRAVPAFVLYDLLAVGYDLLRIVGFEDQKGRKLRAIWRGLRDAFAGVEGPARTANSGQ